MISCQRDPSSSHRGYNSSRKEPCGGKMDVAHRGRAQPSHAAILACRKSDSATQAGAAIPLTSRLVRAGVRLPPNGCLSLAARRETTGVRVGRLARVVIGCGTRGEAGCFEVQRDKIKTK